MFMDLVDEIKKTVGSFEFPHSGHENVVKSNAAIAYARETDELQETERAKMFYLDVSFT